MRRWDSLTEKGIYMKAWPLATLHLILGSAPIFVNKVRQRKQISACCQGTGPYAQRVLLVNKVCVMNRNICNIHGLLANTGYNAGPQSCTFPLQVPDDPFSITITAASQKSCMHSLIIYQTDLLISKRKRSARAMRSISCLCSSNRSVSLFSGTNFSS